MLSVFGWQYPFLIFFLAIPVGFLALAILEAGERQTENTLRQYLATVWHGLSNRRTASLLSISPTLMVINQGFILVFIPVLMATDFGASPTVIGMIFAVRVVFGVIGASSIGWVTSRVREESLIIACLLTLTLGIALVPFANSIIQLFPAIILIGISTGIVFPAFQSLLLGEATEKTRGGVMAANGMTNRFGQTVGPVLSGGLYVIGGIELVFFGGALLIFVMTLFLGVTFYRHHR